MSCAAASRRDTCRLLRRRTTERRTPAFHREPTSPAADRPRCSASSTSSRRPAAVRPWTRPPDCWADLRREGRRSCRRARRLGTAAAGRRPAARLSATKRVGRRTRRTPSGERRRSGRRRTSSRRRRGRRRRRHDVAGGQLSTCEHRRPSLCIIGRFCHVVSVVGHIGCYCCCCCCCYTRDERQPLGGRPASARGGVASPCAEHWRRYNSFIKQRRASVASVIIRRG